MSTWGKRWREAEENGRRGSGQGQKAAREKRQRQQAEAVIRAIPGLVRKAMAERAEAVRLYGWITYEDVPGDDEDRVDHLADRLDRESRPLTAGDLAGCAAIICAWCEANDLECFMVPVRVPMNENEYDLYARPKP